MTEEEQESKKRRRRIGLVLAALAMLLAVLVVPPFVSISHYKGQIASLMSSSLGRPVHLSSVHLRLLLRPAFVIDDLTVDEDSDYGAEPVLHANSVTAAIRLFSLWRGKLEISKISVDEASLNVVRMPDGRWNLDPLLQITASNAGTAAESRAGSLPYLAATNSRINFKDGAEKLPFSLVDTDLSLWRAKPGEWRIRLRGQPARTDVSLNLGDTGIVEMDGSVQRASNLRQMPMRLDLEWRSAQLGQLSRLLTGSDAGWRGDMRGEAHLEGTPDAAKISTRLRATGVHRAEFSSVEPMDFDANCNLVYHYSQRAIENLVCDSPIGDGHIRIAGDKSGNGAAPHYSVELEKVAASAFLDALRTFRGGVDPSLQAAGSVSGSIAYAEVAEANTEADKTDKKARKTHARKLNAAHAQPVWPLSGSLTIDGLQFKGGGLSKPLQVPKLVLEAEKIAQGQPQALGGSVAISAGAPAPLTVNLHLGLRDYGIGLHGQANIQRAKELAHAAGLRQAAVLDAVTGDTVAIDLNAVGPWLPAEETSLSNVQQATANNPTALPATDQLSGTVTLHNSTWKSDYLVNQVQIADATLHLDSDGLRWDPIDFSYGPLKGTATFAQKACVSPEPCSTSPVPEFTVKFDALDAATAQTAMLGAHEKGTLLSDLLNRLHPSAAPAWPRANGVVNVGTLALGPVKLTNATLALKILPASVEIVGLDAKLLGGTVHAAGSLSAGDKPAYALTGDFTKLSPAAVGQMFNQSWSGGTFDAHGKLELAGYTGDDLANSAKGTLHFEWRRGAVAGVAASLPLARFDRWTGDAAIGGGKLSLGQSEVVRGARKQSAGLTVTLEEKPKLSFAETRQPSSKKR
jgi:hypothetical protein